MTTVAQTKTVEKWSSQKNGATVRRGVSGLRCLKGIRLDTREKRKSWECKDERAGWGRESTCRQSRRSQKNWELESLLWSAESCEEHSGDEGRGEAGRCGPRKPRGERVPGGTGQSVLSSSRSGQTSRWKFRGGFLEDMPDSWEGGFQTVEAVKSRIQVTR